MHRYQFIKKNAVTYTTNIYQQVLEYGVNLLLNMSGVINSYILILNVSKSILEMEL